ncbi:ABC transporter substrate-binding protein [Candidatus Poriferisodalis sp.]|uniref:ABC transporter substrate-binding protein n=1 Tax=Candidatus Poriferisodalis sp. TaxID=3101277 RepID=UPI003B0120C6
MTTGRLWRLLALLFAFSLIAAACGSDSDEADGGEGQTQTQETAAPSDGGMDDDDMPDEEGDGGTSALGGAADDDVIERAVAGEEEPDEEMPDEEMPDEEMPDDEMPDEEFDRSTLEGIFAENAARRAATVKMLTEGINSGDYGIDENNMLRGPAGFEIDLNDCPADWSNTGGITGSQVRIGHTTAQSGTLAAYGAIANGWDNYLEWVNANEPIMVNGEPRELELLVKDDAYVAAQTIEFVDELIESENVFAILTLGSPNTFSVYDKINAECIPQPFVMTGHPAWGDPVNHPWTTGMQLSYSTEALLWGAWIRQNLADQLPVKVSGLVMDNDFGLSYEAGFAQWADANPDVVSEFHPIRHDPAAPTITNPMTTIRADNPDVFISMTAGAPCVQAITEAGANGLIEDIAERGGALFTPSVCKAVANYMAPAGDAADGWWIVGGGAKDTTDPTYEDEPFVKWLNENLAAGDLDPKNSLNGTGYWYGYTYVEALRIAAELPGGLNRTNFMLAVRSLSIYHPLMLDGIETELNGAQDAYFVEGSDFSQFDATAQSWNIIGDVVDVNGSSSNCAWGKDEEGKAGCR